MAAVSRDDTLKDSEKCAEKILKMRLWDDEKGGRWKHSVTDIKGEVLCGQCHPFEVDLDRVSRRI